MNEEIKTCNALALLFQNSGPQWGTASDDLNVTVLSWEEGRGVETHVNEELDVVWVVLAGAGEARVDDQIVSLETGTTLLIPKGCSRSVRSTSGRLIYLSVHRRRAGLMPQLKTKEK